MVFIDLPNKLASGIADLNEDSSTPDMAPIFCYLEPGSTFHKKLILSSKTFKTLFIETLQLFNELSNIYNSLKFLMTIFLLKLRVQFGSELLIGIWTQQSN